MGSLRSWAIATAIPPLAVPSSLVRTMPFTPATPMNSRAWLRPFWPTVASRTSSTSCGAPSTSRAAMRRIFSSSAIRLTRVCRRPAVSTRMTSRPRAFPAAIASNTTAAGSAPPCARMKSTPARDAHTCSCSTAAARNVSAAQMSGVRPESLIRRASFPTVVVLPVPLTPTISTTCGLLPLPAGFSALCRIERISLLTRSRSDSPRVRRFFTAVTISSAAATPTSAEMSASSSASNVSTSTGRERCAGSSARRTISSNRSTNCSFVRVSDALILSKNPIVLRTAPNREPSTVNRLLRPLRTKHQRFDRIARGRAALEHRGHLRGERQLHAVARAERQRGAGGAYPFGDHPHVRKNVGQRTASSELDADAAVAAQIARARQDKIAETAESRKRLATAAFRARQTRHLDQTAGDERRHRIVADAQALHDSSRDGDDVLQRAPELDARDIVARVEPQRRTLQALLHLRSRSRIGGRHDDGGRHAARHLECKARTGEHRDGSAAHFLRDHLRHAVERIRLEAFRRADHDGVPADVRGCTLQHVAHPV